MNPKGQAMMAVSKESDIQGTRYLDAVSEVDKPRIEGLMQSAFSGQACEFEFIAAGKGTPRTFASSFVPVFDETGQVERLIGCTQEITSRLATEESRRGLEQQVLHVQKLESLGTLAGGVAHDFNNVLSAVLSNLDAAQLMTGSGKSVRPILDDARDAVETGANMCRQLLAYAGKGRFEISTIQLGRGVKGIISMLRSALPANAEVILDIQDSEVRVEGSAAQIDQVILNLLLNASDALGSARGRVFVGVSSEVVRQDDFVPVIGSAADGQYGVVSIRDEGEGMPSDVVNQIFDPFFSTKESGRGLGLAAVAGVIRSHNGCLRLETEPGQGSCF